MLTFEEFLRWATSQGANLLTVCLKTVIVGAIGCILIKIVTGILRKVLENSKLDKAAHGLILTLAKTVLYVLLGLILASGLGIDVTGIVALASVATLALSLALQNMLANVIGGFTLLYTHPFASGDYVEIAGKSGTVKEVGMAYTKLTTPDNKLISIPNSAVVAAEIVNYTVTGSRRVDFTYNVAYGSDPEAVVAALLATAKNDERILLDPAPFAALSSYGESSVAFVLRVWTKTDDYWNVYFDINRRVQDTFKENGIEVTYPHLNVHIEK